MILACNTATGINSIIGYNVGILLQSGLSDLQAHWGYVLFTCVNFSMTMVGMMLVDRKGRRFLFIVGTSGIIVSLVGVGILFLRTEKFSIDAGAQVQSMVGPNQELTLRFDPAEASTLLAAQGATGSQIDSNRASLAIIYSYGDFTAATSFVRSDDTAAAPIQITRDTAVPDNGSRPSSRIPSPISTPPAPRRSESAKPSSARCPMRITAGWSPSAFICFMAFYAMGPGVCVWLALSELMPTRIRSNGMSIALLINQLVSTILAGIFLPFVRKYGYSSMFFLFCGVHRRLLHHRRLLPAGDQGQNAGRD